VLQLLPFTLGPVHVLPSVVADAAVIPAPIAPGFGNLRVLVD
jgi:hypothetical protein